MFALDSPQDRHSTEVLGFSLVNESSRKHVATMPMWVAIWIWINPTGLFQQLSGISLILRMLILGVHLAAFTHQALIVLSLRFINDDLTSTF